MSANEDASFFIELPRDDSSLHPEDEEFILANINLFDIELVHEPEAAFDLELVQEPETANVVADVALANGQMNEPQGPETNNDERNEQAIDNPGPTNEISQPSNPKRFKQINETELQDLQNNFHQAKATKQNTKWGVKLFQGVLTLSG